MFISHSLFNMVCASLCPLILLKLLPSRSLMPSNNWSGWRLVTSSAECSALGTAHCSLFVKLLPQLAGHHLSELPCPLTAPPQPFKPSPFHLFTWWHLPGTHICLLTSHFFQGPYWLQLPLCLFSKFTSTCPLMPYFQSISLFLFFMERQRSVGVKSMDSGTKCLGYTVSRESPKLVP